MQEKENPTNDLARAIRDIKDGEWYWIHKGVIQRHGSRIGAIGVTVYNFLASLVDKNQRCYPSQKYLADRLGYSRATVNKAIRVLEEEGLIWVERRSRYHCSYRLLRVRCKAAETQMSKGRNSDVSQVDTNKNKLTRINTNKERGIKKYDFSFKPETREEQLAYDIATSLSDFGNMPRYLSLAKRFPESLLRRVLSEAKEIPKSKVKTSRTAILNYFLNKYVRQNNYHPGD